MSRGGIQLDLCGLPCEARLLVAVSGGCDSIALLHALLDHGYRNLGVAHVNHQLRGKASEEDAAFVRGTSERLGLPYHEGVFDVSRIASERKVSIEAAARDVRYGFLAKVAYEVKADALVLAHHADDLAETLLFNLLRGSGMAGLTSLKKRRVRTFILGDGTRFRLPLIRPLLHVPKSEIEDYITKYRIPYQEDATNHELLYTRNRIRHELIPLAESILGRNVREALQRSSQLFEDEEAWITDITKKYYREAISPYFPDDRLSLPALKEAPVALQRRLLQRWLKEHGVPKIGFREIENVRHLVETTHVSKVNLPGGYFARRREKTLFIEKPSPENHF